MSNVSTPHSKSQDKTNEVKRKVISFNQTKKNYIYRHQQLLKLYTKFSKIAKKSIRSQGPIHHRENDPKNYNIFGINDLILSQDEQIR